MSVWIVTYNSLIQDTHYTGGMIIEKASLTKEAAQSWNKQQEHRWQNKTRELPIPE